MCFSSRSLPPAHLMRGESRPASAPPRTASSHVAITGARTSPRTRIPPSLISPCQPHVSIPAGGGTPALASQMGHPRMRLSHRHSCPHSSSSSLLLQPLRPPCPLWFNSLLSPPSSDLRCLRVLCGRSRTRPPSFSVLSHRSCQPERAWYNSAQYARPG